MSLSSIFFMAPTDSSNADQLQTDDSLAIFNLINTIGYTDDFGTSIDMKGCIMLGQVCDNCGYADTPIYGYAILKNSLNTDAPGVFEFGNHGLTGNLVAMRISLVDGSITIPPLAFGSLSLVTIDSTGKLLSQGVLTEYANNAAAIAAGKYPGQFYKTGDFVKVVH